MKVLLIRKLIGLGRDEDGAALVITLALLMFMYVTCAGVLAIGQSVKDRIHLQNACDAAAYSAAVVQADTLSRIATINKAMSWTYVSMTQRQQDYVVCSWLELVRDRYWLDYLAAETITDIELNLSQTVSYNTIKSTLDEFFRKRFSHESFYSRQGDYGKNALARQIDDDRIMLDEMKERNDDLASGLAMRIDAVVKETLTVNMSPRLLENCRFRCDREQDFFRYMDNSEEADFVKFAEDSYVSYDSHTWFPVTGPGIGRKYEQRPSKLRADWTWTVKITHEPRWTAVLGSEAHDGYFDAHPAYPKRLKDSYFGSAGTITVGLAKYNENPWARVFGPKTEVSRNGMDRLAGIFAAFNPYKHVEWSWAFSSAKAGYREKGGEYDGTRAYRVDWDSQDPSWNLCVSDWDAVFVPVRSACMEAKDGSWKLTSGNNDFLKKWIESGDWKAFDGFNPPQYDLARNGMPRLPRMHNARGTIHDINWTRLRDMLYH